MSKDKLPSIHFYPGDWWKDNEVQTLDHFHKGVWFELILIMFESPERGVLLQQNGQQMVNSKAARRLRLGEQEYENALNELLEAGVCRRREDGAIYSARMVRDEQERINKSIAGKASAEARAAKLLEQNSQQNGNRTATAPDVDVVVDDDVDGSKKDNGQSLLQIPKVKTAVGLWNKKHKEKPGRHLNEITIEALAVRLGNDVDRIVEAIIYSASQTNCFNIYEPPERAQPQKKAQTNAEKILAIGAELEAEQNAN